MISYIIKNSDLIQIKEVTGQIVQEWFVNEDICLIIMILGIESQSKKQGNSETIKHLHGRVIDPSRF